MSVVIPCFNYGRFLGEAIESVLGQTHQPMEVIVVNDGSTDDSVAVARRYPATLICLNNGGVCVAANAGFAAAHGEFVLRLDADDKLTPTFVEETLAALEDHPEAHFAYTDAAYFGARTGNYPVQLFDPETLAERNYINASALMRRASLQRVGGYNVNMSGGRYEDWDLWLGFAERGMPGVLVNKQLLLYRQHSVPSRATLRLKTLNQLRSEIVMAARLQDNHPELYRPRALLRRLGALPFRFLRRQISLRVCGLLLSLNGLMLVRSAIRTAQWMAPRGERASSQKSKRPVVSR